MPINYIVTVNFRGFRQLVDKLGGVWMDVDRRYYNDHGGPTGYAKINLQPGYQRMNGTKALDFVRTGTPTPTCIATRASSCSSAPSRIRSSRRSRSRDSPGDQGRHVERGGRPGWGKDVSAKTVLRYAALAYSLPPGHTFQARIDGLEGFSDLTTSPENLQRAVREFRNPDVESPCKATAVALGEKLKEQTPPPRETSVLVLNGNGVEGSASSASYLLSQRGYQMIVPPDGLPANAPSYDYFRTEIYFDPGVKGAKPAAKKLAGLFGSANVKKLVPKVRALGNDAMLVVVLGETFHGRLASAPIDQTPKRQPAAVVSGASATVDLLREYRRQIGFPLMVPTRIERSSWIDREKPIRVYAVDPDKEHKAVRLTYRLGLNEYWGVQMTDWNAPTSPPQLRAEDRRAPGPAVLQRAAPAHGRAAYRRRHLLGGQHAPRPPLERDDDRDREGPTAARRGEQGVGVVARPPRRPRA